MQKLCQVPEIRFKGLKTYLIERYDHKLHKEIRGFPTFWVGSTNLLEQMNPLSCRNATGMGTTVLLCVSK